MEALNELKEEMQKAVNSLISSYERIRAGRVTSAIFDKVLIENYGVKTPLSHLANISIPEARLVVIQPWDKTLLKAMEKAILNSDLSLNPSSDGNVLRIKLPPLTQERRKELVKIVKKEAEEKRVIVRNIRRHYNDNLKKNKDISEDEVKRHLDEAQKLTDSFIKKIDEIALKKEADIMEV